MFCLYPVDFLEIVFMDEEGIWGRVIYHFFFWIIKCIFYIGFVHNNNGSSKGGENNISWNFYMKDRKIVFFIFELKNKQKSCLNLKIGKLGSTYAHDLSEVG
jgi:outer membrane phospholipase A